MEGIIWVLDWIGRIRLISVLRGGVVTAGIAKLLEAPSWVIFGFSLIGACIGLRAVNILQNYQSGVKAGKSPQVTDMFGRPYETHRQKVPLLRSIPAVTIIGMIAIIVVVCVGYLNYKPSEQLNARTQPPP